MGGKKSITTVWANNNNLCRHDQEMYFLYWVIDENRFFFHQYWRFESISRILHRLRQYVHTSCYVAPENADEDKNLRGVFIWTLSTTTVSFTTPSSHIQAHKTKTWGCTTRTVNHFTLCEPCPALPPPPLDLWESLQREINPDGRNNSHTFIFCFASISSAVAGNRLPDCIELPPDRRLLPPTPIARRTTRRAFSKKLSSCSIAYQQRRPTDRPIHRPHAMRYS